MISKRLLRKWHPKLRAFVAELVDEGYVLEQGGKHVTVRCPSGSRVGTIASPPNHRQLLTMPIYEYICAHCSHAYEKTQKTYKSRPPRACPKCEGRGRQKKQIGSGISLRFNGPGFYCNDYPKNKKRR